MDRQEKGMKEGKDRQSKEKKKGWIEKNEKDIMIEK